MIIIMIIMRSLFYAEKSRSKLVYQGITHAVCAPYTLFVTYVSKRLKNVV